MTRQPIAYMPLSTYPEAISDAAILDALHMATALGCQVQVASFAADMPHIYSPIGDVAFDVQTLMAGAKKVSAAEAQRLETLVSGAPCDLRYTYHPSLGVMTSAAAAEARLYDVALIPWQRGAVLMQDLAQALIFGAGRPTVLLPEGTKISALTHIALAWDGSRVAARALNDALPYLQTGGRLSVLTAISGNEAEALARATELATALQKRGYDASAIAVAQGSQTIATALQNTAQAQGAQILAMGGFGHSRLRDFVLGGATQDVLANLQMPVLLSH
jgi:nucleotide-binding universal stress UspA family protein